MNKFNRGDRVEIISNDGTTAQKERLGQVGIIDSLSDDYGHDVRFIDGGRVYFHKYRLKLVSGSNELEELVRKANEGEEAAKVLAKKYGSQVEISSDVEPYTLLSDFMSRSELYSCRYRVKPKPTFEPFSVGDWRVRLDGDTLHIGCQEVPAKEAKRGLQALIKENVSRFNSLDIPMEATRDGIRARGNVLPWADAEKILEALTKAGV